MHVKAPTFQLSFLHPRYWLTWVTVVLLYLISWLPYRVQWWIGTMLGRFFYHVIKSRRRIAERNIELCFPDMSEAERKALVKANLESAGIALFEAGMGWWWPDWRVKRIGKMVGYDHIQAIMDKGKGVLGIACHNMNLEMAGRVIGVVHPSVGFYRRHNNPLMEYLQYHGRSKSNKYMIHKKGVGDLIKALDQGELCFYLPDQDYGPKRCEYVPFFAVKDAATTTGTLLFAEKANCETVFLLPLRTKTGYEVQVLPGLENFPSGDDKEDVTRVNQMIEKMVLAAPSQYLWMHKRFKTRPDWNPTSLY
ncbi:LpxL/LpxP family Kdo(2)-lipid IV(A) lauroyl/palmitoleoyl acyltransferase [Aliiglaciecola sp. CAU 1673]|uniref:LpxL/LpxP family Kdo(2)-lipid IV(A) lauroyl/palmitoleoyl acyltransferase n=1 Tax=Aliiglaciecola sp. CAU 1673 TaxID=3032595 RepID=UPI0023D9DB8C|nr:LpxL/LpxP family Kdo(2)-lipid IV(A) lauroyl/palmitoleoyl acyltransferase [Aliiglaciecola sp. CAU 1673]MDF2180038.1 LpxL/LpxP family Kdo(2)-lipid IV(A) lauroyl/palmitoleoyl acyltransferase [Aliiglaciecola sp. CAU 1673]